MARKSKPAENEFVLYNVVYEDGSLSSNRKLPNADIDPYDRDGSVRTLLERQDQKIAEASGKSRGPIKSVTLSPN
jgi:hypothetical protein